MDAETELSISKILRGEKLWKNYFILPELDSCQPIETNRAENWDSCGITSQYKSNQLRQLVSEFGGKSFSSLGAINLRPGIFDFFFFMRHTLEATALLTLKGVVHYDLHRSNILIDTLGVPRLLDFGMAFDATRIDDQILNDRWKQYDPKYDSEPPEITVITGIRKGMNLDAAVKDCVYGKPVFKTYELIFGVPRLELIEKLRGFLKKSRSFEKHEWVTFFQTYWPGLDSFALGAALLHILQTQLTWPSFVESEEWQKNESKIYQVLKRMLSIDPSERFDCVEALYLLDPDNVVLKNNVSWIEARRTQRQE
jgi:serine/threonine protein kinase